MGFHRYWVAEHHGAGFVAGRTPEVLIAAIAAATSTSRVGSRSVLLNQYSPLKVAEVFCTLNELYPERIDLGVGRATTGRVLDVALQQDRSQPFHSNSDQQIAELVAWLDHSFPAGHPFSQTPLESIAPRPQLHLLGSSPWSASAAAALGLRYVFAGFINQQQAGGIIRSYRDNFCPASGQAGVQQPEVILAVHVVCADTEEEARRQLAPVQVMYRNLARGIIAGVLPSPAAAELGGLPPAPTYVPGSRTPPQFVVGTPASVHLQLQDLAQDFAVDELIIQELMTDQAARLRSFALLADVFQLRPGKA